MLMQKDRYFVTKMLAFIVIALFLIRPTIAQPQWNNQDDWDPLTIEGEWLDAAGVLWFGPVIADLTSDGEKEIIIADLNMVRVYASDADDPDDPLFTIQPDVPEDYYIRSIPSIGDIDGDGIQDIVFTCNKDHGYDIEEPHDINVQTQLSFLFVYNGENGDLIDQCDMGQFLKAETPALADIDVLDFNPESPTYEDNRMEIILAGWSYNHIYQPAGNGSRISWSLKIYRLSQQNELIPIDSDNWTFTNLNAQYPIGRINSPFLIPAVGDMDGDGLKEIVMNYLYGYRCWTYDLTQQHPLDLLFSFEMEDTPPDPNNPEGFFCVGPILTDIENDGSMRAVIPHYHGNGQTTVLALDINEENLEDWGETFTGHNANFFEAPSAADL